jgi:hypothetical protein
MADPQLTVLGVYRPQISAETWQEQWNVTADDEETQHHFAHLALIEAVVENLPGPLIWERLVRCSSNFPTTRAE